MTSIGLKEQRRRDFTAVGIALILHLFIAGAFILSGILFFNDVEEYRGPVLVKLGRADAPEEEAEALPVSPVETVESPESTISEPVEKAEERESGAPEETVKPETADNESTVESPVSEEESGDSGQAAESAEASEGESGVEAVDAPPAAVEDPVTITHGREEGNAYETTYESEPGLVGRNVWIPIYLYMPLPQYIDLGIVDSMKSDSELDNRPGTRTAESKRVALRSYYSIETAEGLYLKEEPDPDLRPQVWSLLEDGGYSIRDAEYKAGRRLRPVVITFTIVNEDDRNALRDVTVTRSSGYGDIDEAVVYGFMKAQFYNSAEIPVKGRFTYRFD